MVASWQRELNTTIHKYVRQEEENILRDRKILAMMRSKGRITFSHSGDLVDWKVRYKRAPLRVFRETDTLTFGRVNRWKSAQVDWRGYAATDSITKMEKLKNKGTEAIIKVFSQMTENLMADIEENFGDELYVDGYATSNAGRLHGFESALGYSGPATNGFVATPSDTYGGLSTVLGTYGGNWSTQGGATKWPDGVGDPEYDFWSPLIVDYTDTFWATPPAAQTWADSCEKAMRYGINKMMKNKSRKGMLNMILLERELYRIFLQTEVSKERVLVARGEKGGLVSLGFTDVVNLDGTEVSSEYGVPVDANGYGMGYGLAMQHVELMSLQDKLFVTELPDFDLASYSDRFAIDFFGNMRFNPRYLLAFKKVT